jgi:predicted amidohydrolase
MVVGLAGDVIVKAGTSEQLLIADLDLIEVPRAREKRPCLSLRRPEAYE